MVKLMFEDSRVFLLLLLDAKIQNIKRQLTFKYPFTLYFPSCSTTTCFFEFLMFFRGIQRSFIINIYVIDIYSYGQDWSTDGLAVGGEMMTFCCIVKIYNQWKNANSEMVKLHLEGGGKLKSSCCNIILNTFYIECLLLNVLLSFSFCYRGVRQYGLCSAQKLNINPHGYKSICRDVCCSRDFVFIRRVEQEQRHDQQLWSLEIQGGDGESDGGK